MRALRKSRTRSGAEPEVSSRETILNAAEEVFAKFGFEGASMRVISEAAGVAQALLHYHFQNKDTLFAAVFERRAAAINQRRNALIDALFAKTETPALEDLLAILLFPGNPAPEEDPGNYNMFHQIVSATSVAADERSKQLMARFYDAIAHRFIWALRRIIPSLSQEKAMWCYLFALGARVQTSAPIDRAARLCGSAERATAEAAFALLVPFVAAGIRRLAGEDG